MQSSTIDLVEWFRSSDYDPDDLELATHEFVQRRLSERTSRGLEISRLGHQVRIDVPAFDHGGPRIWSGPDELPDAIDEPEAESDPGPAACPV